MPTARRLLAASGLLGAALAGCSGAAVSGPPPPLTTLDLRAGDGLLDLVTADSGADTASVLLGRGNGTFAAAVPYATSAFPAHVVCGDLDGDGVADFATADASDDQVSVFLGHGDGTFAPAVTAATGAGPIGLCRVDLGGDGLADLVSVNSLDDTVTVLRNASR